MSDRSHHGIASHGSLLVQEGRTANHDLHGPTALLQRPRAPQRAETVAHFDETARQLTGWDERVILPVNPARRNMHDHQWLHPLLTQPCHHPNHAPTRAHPATYDPTESWYSPTMPRNGVGHAGVLYGRVYGDPD